MCRELIAIAGSFISGERLSSSLLSRFRGWIAAERARIMMAALKSRDWDMAWQEAQEGLKVSTSGFLVFLLRRAVAIPTARARRRSEERRVGKESVSTCRFRRGPSH